MTRAVIRAEYARMIRPFIYKDEIRYYLQGFHVEPHPTKGVFIVATDGYRMGIFYDEEGFADGNLIVRLDNWMFPLLRAERGGKRAMPRFLEVTDKPSRAAVYRNHPDQAGLFVASQGDATIDGEFPDWRKVVPKEFPEKLAAPAFNFDVLSAFGSIRESDPKRTSCRFRLLGGGLMEPAIVLTGRKDFVGIVMPMNDDVITGMKAYPDWFPKPDKVKPTRKRKAA